MQDPPPAPHAAFVAPARQIPRDVSQQPPLQDVWIRPPQAALQTWVAVLQAMSAGQSADVLQPHDRVWATHAEPFEFPVQSRQEPEPPHWVTLVPGAHEPLAPQQPTAHGLFAEHVSVQRPVDRLQPALVDGHSAFAKHPHWPPPDTDSQDSPLVPAVNPAVQLAQTTPLFPQAAAFVPG